MIYPLCISSVRVCLQWFIVVACMNMLDVYGKSLDVASQQATLTAVNNSSHRRSILSTFMKHHERLGMTTSTAQFLVKIFSMSIW